MEETLRMAVEARDKRREVEKELQHMEGDLRDRLADLAGPKAAPVSGSTQNAAQPAANYQENGPALVTPPPDSADGFRLDSPELRRSHLDSPELERKPLDGSQLDTPRLESPAEPSRAPIAMGQGGETEKPAQAPIAMGRGGEPDNNRE